MKVRYARNIAAIFLLLSISYIAEGQKKTHKEAFTKIIESEGDEQSKSTATRKYLNDLSEEELPKALSEISTIGDANFIAYETLTPVAKKFEKRDFRNVMMKELEKEGNTADYKIVLIDFLEKFQKKERNAEESAIMNDTYYSIAKNTKENARVRQIAASKIGLSADHAANKVKIKELISTNDIALINGSAKAAKKYVRSKEFAGDMDEWVDVLIESLERNKTRIKELTGPINTLGYAQTDKARNYLMRLFDEHSKTDAKFTEILAYSLSNNANETSYNKIVTEYRTNKNFNNFGSELTLTTIANDNTQLVEQLYNKNTIESKLNYLRSVKYLKESDNKNQWIENSKILMRDASEDVRLEAVKTLRFLLSYEEEQRIFREHLNNESSDIVKNEIYFYIGR